MGFTADTAILTADQFHAITQERAITGRDQGESTLANALIEATNYIIKRVRARGVPPSKVSNTADFRHIAAFWAARRIIEGMPGDTGAVAQKIDLYTRRIDEEWESIIIEIDDGGRIKNNARRGMPRVYNLDAEPRLAGPTAVEHLPRNVNPFHETRKFNKES